VRTLWRYSYTPGLLDHMKDFGSWRSAWTFLCGPPKED
jgi:hypothetical protein